MFPSQSLTIYRSYGLRLPPMLALHILAAVGTLCSQGTNCQAMTRKRHRPRKRSRPRSVPASNAAVDADTVHYVSDEEDAADANDDDDDNNNKPGLTKPSMPNSSSFSEEEEDSEPDLQLNGVASGESDVDVDLEFFDPRLIDITPVSIFLSKFVTSLPAARKETPQQALSARALAQTICEQRTVGTIVRVADDDNPVGLISVLNLRLHKTLLAPILNRLQRAADAQNQPQFFATLRKGLDGDLNKPHRNVGLILCERVVNLPPQIIPKLLEALFSEIEWATEDEPTEERRKSFRFDHYLYIAEVFETSTEKRTNDEGGPAAKKSKTESEQGGQVADDKVSYTRVEDEVWANHASQSISWSVTTTADEGEPITRKMVAMIIPRKRVLDIRAAVARLVGVPTEDDE